MGLAQEWLGIEGCRSLAFEMLQHAKERRQEIWAYCPWHNEKTPGNAFSYNIEKDQAKCQSCGGRGDLITVWSACKGYNEEEGFKEFKKRYGKDAPEVRRPKQPEKKYVNYYDHKKDLMPAPEKWKERAMSFVLNSFDRLMNNPKAMEELDRRWGIAPETVIRCGLGVNDRDKWVPVTSWGLDHEKRGNKERKIWLPKGLVIPCFGGEDDKEVRKIKIRRQDPSTPWGESRRYWEVSGGENWRFHCYFKKGARPRVVIVVEAERDAVLLSQICDDTMGAIAGGGATKRPYDERVMDLIKGAEVLLVALDTDLAGGKNTIDFWLKEFGFAIHWPVPKEYGKDVGDAWQKGMDIQKWTMAGLPERLR